MGGKGQRRREKNYRAAHGGYTRLPPPPKPNEIDALPSKLRKLVDFTSPKPNNNNNNNSSSSPSKPSLTTTTGSSKALTDTERKGKKRGAGGESKPDSKDEPGSKATSFSEEGNDEKVITPRHKDSEDEISHGDKHDKRKAKRMRKQVNDLRFEQIAQGPGSTGLKRKEHKKKYLEAKKNKHKKSKTEESLDFPGHEEIKFGEVVEAPPKLSAVRRGLKTVQDASHERLRLKAVEAYRNRKGWVSRPGIQIPAP